MCQSRADKLEVLRIVRFYSPLPAKEVREMLNWNRWFWQKYTTIGFYFLVGSIPEIELYYKNQAPMLRTR